ncbi:MAG: methyltransferase domain-containing protein [Chloroflexi bacterium]|nr:methyltransferase domain-containing protein [Chloroflexota bacterium]
MVTHPVAPDFGLVADLHPTTCPACGYHVAVPFYDGGAQPLATLAWPGSIDEARTMLPLPLNFVSCVDCGHVWNAAFDYRAVPYTDKPNLMFNRGLLWSGHLQAIRSAILERVPARPTVVEIGHGDASFLAALAADRPEGRFVGFDPNGTARADGVPVELRAALFDPRVHLAELRPDLIVSRHVLEHLTDPLGFVQQLSFGAVCGGIQPLLYLEVPCIDRAIETRRTVDFYYEHNSNYTTESFTRMLQRCGVSIDSIGHGYDGEVIFAFIRLGGAARQVEYARRARSFRDATDRSRATITRQLDALATSGARVAIWGGTGKSAAFIHQHGADAARFPLVVDSDAAKAGTFVPGTGQQIQFRDVLHAQPVDVVIVPPQWRARDIVAEMRLVGIAVERVLIEHEGRLVDFLSDPHPYPRD